MSSENLEKKLDKYYSHLREGSEPELNKKWYYLWEGDFIDTIIGKCMARYPGIDGCHGEEGKPNFSKPPSLTMIASQAHVLNCYLKKLFIMVKMRNFHKGLPTNDRIEDLVDEYNEFAKLSHLEQPTSPKGEFVKLTKYQKCGITQLYNQIPLMVYFYPFFTNIQRRFLLGMQVLDKLRDL
jgi:hypothetical protein